MWQEISATLKPLKSRKTAKPLPLIPIAKAPGGSAGGKLAEKAKSALQFSPGQPVAPAPPAALRPTPHIDEKTARKLRRGQVAIDARIDLHGRTEAEAHDALLRFFSGCVARRQRLVLVITGKGERSGGLLRRSVPRWFGEPAFRNILSGYSTAGPAHGGEGALYVRLRNPLRSGAGSR